MVFQHKQVIGRVYIVRHGETQENQEGIIQGQTDTQLNELGRVQAEKVGNALQGKVLRAAYSSDLARAVDVSAIRGMEYEGFMTNGELTDCACDLGAPSRSDAGPRRGVAGESKKLL